MEKGKAHENVNSVDTRRRLHTRSPNWREPVPVAVVLSEAVLPAVHQAAAVGEEEARVAVVPAVAGDSITDSGYRIDHSFL